MAKPGIFALGLAGFIMCQGSSVNQPVEVKPMSHDWPRQYLTAADTSEQPTKACPDERQIIKIGPGFYISSYDCREPKANMIDYNGDGVIDVVIPPSIRIETIEKLYQMNGLDEILMRISR